jgi:2-polyprenyl-3-methyl-5-hydroxy-6-metoxy-1,4-benzoquinol methylase
MSMQNKLSEQNVDGSLVPREIDFDKLRYKIALKLISGLDVRGKKVLDIGCGVGEFSVILKEEGSLPVCLDINIRNIQKVKSLGLPAMVHDINQRLPFDSESFDFAISLEVIEHIPNAEFHLSEIFRILKKDGYVILSTPNAAYYLFRLKSILGQPPHQEGYHYRFFVKKTLNNLLKQQGFKIVKRNAVIYAFLYNRIRKLFDKSPVWLRLPVFMESILARNFFILAKKG